MNLHPAINKFILFLHGGYKAHPQNVMAQLEQALGYSFTNKALLTLSLTHKSFPVCDETRDAESNERLEFLGDAVLNCLVSHYLYATYPDMTEGHMSKIKSLVVSRKIIGEIAEAINLQRYVLLGPSEQRTVEWSRNSILTNTFEALLGGLYLDGGLEATRKLLQKTLFCRIEEFISDENNINYKSSILEQAQQDGFGIPRYTVVATTGPEHHKMFRVRVDIAGVVMGEGTGHNKKLAEQSAAQIASSRYSKEFVLLHKEGVEKDELVSD